MYAKMVTKEQVSPGCLPKFLRGFCNLIRKNGGDSYEEKTIYNKTTQ